MRVIRVEKPFRISIMTLVTVTACFGNVMAQTGHAHTTTTANQQLSTAQGALLQAVRESTARFKDVSSAEAEGYSLLFGCVNGPDSGAMGLNYVNLSLVGSGVVDTARPQIVIYEPQPGRQQEIDRRRFSRYRRSMGHGTSRTRRTPADGTALSLFRSSQPLRPSCVLHVTRVAWKQNPNGAFVNWHPNVSCQSFGGL